MNDDDHDDDDHDDDDDAKRHACGAQRRVRWQQYNAALASRAFVPSKRTRRLFIQIANALRNIIRFNEVHARPQMLITNAAKAVNAMPHTYNDDDDESTAS